MNKKQNRTLPLIRLGIDTSWMKMDGIELFSKS